MACPYCYNPQIVREAGTLSEEEALNFLKTRQGRLEGVVLSGGECTLYPRLEQFCEAIKALGYKIKIDTNTYYNNNEEVPLSGTVVLKDGKTYVPLTFFSTVMNKVVKINNNNI